MTPMDRRVDGAGGRRVRRSGVPGWLPALAILASAAGPGTALEQELTVADLGIASGFQDNWDNHYRRGRSIVADDFDGDGRLDCFVGNPGDESFVFRNLGPGPDGAVRFAPAPILLRGDLAFVASGADCDNDGDLDLFVGCGGLDGSCFDFLFRNDSAPGEIRFTDVSLAAGIRGPAPEGFAVAHSSGGGTWGDYDRDGDPDLYVSLRDFRSGELFQVWLEEGDPGLRIVDLVLGRAPEARWPRGVGYWLDQARTLAAGLPDAREDAGEVAEWMEAIRDRYPDLAGFDSAGALLRTLEGSAPHLGAERLRRHLAATLLNLASGRLSSFTPLLPGGSVADLVEDAYRRLGAPGDGADEASRLAAFLEALNEGELFP